MEQGANSLWTKVSKMKFLFENFNACMGQYRYGGLHIVWGTRIKHLWLYIFCCTIINSYKKLELRYYVLNYLLSNSFIIFEDKEFFFVSRINVSVLNIFVRIYGLKLCDCGSEEIYLSSLLIKMSRFYCHDNILDSW